ncbi:MAG: polyprenyl synthetase family protein, partial [Gordonia polyisoprenivorans]|nr:polyprenyl synthetase family protein [Gordonia polyisoprenivorans]
LGVFGDPDRTGKPSGDDLAEGKRTALLALGLERAELRDPRSAAVLRDAVGRRLDDHELNRIRELLVDVGAVEEIERRVTALLDAAVARLERAEIGTDIRADLIAMAGRIAHREA